MSKQKRAQHSNAVCWDAQRRTRAVGEFCAENCSDFDAENLTNRRRTSKNSVANKLSRISKRNARQQNAHARFNDAHNAKRARFSKNFAKNCHVFGAENLKNRRRKRGISVAKNFSAVLKAAHEHAKTSAVSDCEFWGCRTLHARGRRILGEKLHSFRRRKLEK